MARNARVVDFVAGEFTGLILRLLGVKRAMLSRDRVSRLSARVDARYDRRHGLNWLVWIKKTDGLPSAPTGAASPQSRGRVNNPLQDTILSSWTAGQIFARFDELWRPSSSEESLAPRPVEGLPYRRSGDKAASASLASPAQIVATGACRAPFGPHDRVVRNGQALRASLHRWPPPGARRCGPSNRSRVLAWSERSEPAEIYPTGINGAIAYALGLEKGISGHGRQPRRPRARADRASSCVNGRPDRVRA